MGLSERRASRRKIYSRIRGFSSGMAGDSLQVLKDRREHEEQRERLQRLHSGHELLRRNIKEKRFIDDQFLATEIVIVHCGGHWQKRAFTARDAS